MKIKLLTQDIINKISAGEVIEKPANVVKELVENSIDAGSNTIKVELERSGRNLIKITDDGCGISCEEMPLAVQRHATSKLNTDDLYDINYMGFRGEALHSIAVTSKLKIFSSGWKFDVNSEKISPYPAFCGTVIEVRDLFYNIPNKLRFLRSEATELQAIIEIINKLALINHDVSFEIISEGRRILKFDSANIIDRISQIKALGTEFVQNMIHIKNCSNSIEGEFYLGIPTFNKTKAINFIFVNKRPIKDNIVSACIKNAYADYIPKNAYPVSIIFLNLPNQEVDVNIHPTKSEVRFQNPVNVRSFVVSSLKSALNTNNYSTSTAISAKTLEKFTTCYSSAGGDLDHNYFSDIITKQSSALKNNIKIEKKVQNVEHTKNLADAYNLTFNARQIPFKDSFKEEEKKFNFAPTNAQQTTTIYNKENEEEKSTNQTEFGEFKCQIHESFILTETEDAIILIDQHAAHERVLYEKMKNNIDFSGQNLLVPEVIEFDIGTVDSILPFAKELQKIGITIEKLGDSAITVNSIPQILKKENIKDIIQKITELCYQGIEIKQIIERVYADIACKCAIKANHKLTGQEVNQLLLQMEKTPHSSQCNHGRPTYITLSKKEIKKLFERI